MEEKREIEGEEWGKKNVSGNDQSGRRGWTRTWRWASGLLRSPLWGPRLGGPEFEACVAVWRMGIECVLRITSGVLQRLLLKGPLLKTQRDTGLQMRALFALAAEEAGLLWTQHVSGTYLYERHSDDRFVIHDVKTWAGHCGWIDRHFTRCVQCSIKFRLAMTEMTGPPARSSLRRKKKLEGGQFYQGGSKKRAKKWAPDPRHAGRVTMPRLSQMQGTGPGCVRNTRLSCTVVPLDLGNREGMHPPHIAHPLGRTPAASPGR